MHAALELPEWTGAYDLLGSVRSSAAALRSAQPLTAAGGTRSLAVLVRPAHRTGRRARRARQRRRCRRPRLRSGHRGRAGGRRARGPRHRVVRVPRPVADPRRGRLQGVGGALRPGGLRPPGPGGLRRRVEAGRDRGRRRRPPGGGRAARPGRRGRDRSRSGPAPRRWWPTGPSVVGNLGAAQAGLLLADVLERADAGPADRRGGGGRRGRRVRVPGHRRLPAVRAAGRPGAWPRWRSRPPRVGTTSPTPASSPGATSCAASRPVGPTPSARVRRRPGGSRPWKSGFTASDCRACGFRHLPPSRVCLRCRTIDEMDPVRMADVGGRVATFTVDHLAYSPSPPVVGAVVDFDGGGRYRCEMTDVDPDRLAIGTRVEMAFRRPVHGQGRPQLLLEGPTGGDAGGRRRGRRGPRRRHDEQQRDPRPGGHRRDGVHPVRRALGQGRRRPPARRGQGHHRLGRGHPGRHRRLLAGHHGVRGVRGRPCPSRSRSTTSRCPGSRTSAPPAPRPSATPATPWPRAPTTWPWPSGWRS